MMGFCQKIVRIALCITDSNEDCEIKKGRPQICTSHDEGMEIRDLHQREKRQMWCNN